MYEYHVLRVQVLNADKELNFFADQGWRVVGATSSGGWLVYTLEKTLMRGGYEY